MLGVSFGLLGCLDGIDEVHSSFLNFSFGFWHEVVTPVSGRSFYTRCNAKRDLIPVLGFTLTSR